MIRGTTPRHIFELPFDEGYCREIEVTYQQGGENILMFKRTDLSYDETSRNIFWIMLTQELTLMFKADIPVDIQVKVLTAANEVLASQIIRISVDKILNEEVITSV